MIVGNQRDQQNGPTADDGHLIAVYQPPATLVVHPPQENSASAATALPSERITRNNFASSLIGPETHAVAARSTSGNGPAAFAVVDRRVVSPQPFARVVIPAAAFSAIRPDLSADAAAALMRICIG